MRSPGRSTRESAASNRPTGGTIFLDEIGEMPPGAQSKLLRVLEEREFERVGGSKTHEGDVRVIAATNRNLEQAISKGDFRQDLFYRLNVFPIHCPPLRDRKSDIPLLAAYFSRKHAALLGKPNREIPPDVMRHLVSYRWSGNVRELENAVQRAVLVAEGAALSFHEVLPVPPARRGAADHPDERQPEIESLNEHERNHITSVLQKTNWVVSGPKGAAGILKVHPNTLRSRMKKLGLREGPHEVS